MDVLALPGSLETVGNATVSEPRDESLCKIHHDLNPSPSQHFLMKNISILEIFIKRV